MPIFSEKPHTKIKFQDFGKASAFTSESKKTARTVGEGFFQDRKGGASVLVLAPLLEPKIGLQKRRVPGTTRPKSDAKKRSKF